MLEPDPEITSADLPGCINRRANLLEALKTKIRHQVSQGAGRVELSAEVVLYLIDRAQRWERMNHVLEVPTSAGEASS